MKFSKIALSYIAPGVSATYAVTPLVFPLDDGLSSAPYVITDIDGLDPPEIDLSIKDTAVVGSVLQNARAQNREITIQIAFQPNYSVGQTVSDLRDALYAWLTPKHGVNMSILVQNAAGTTLVSTVGRIKRMEQALFTKDPEMVITFEALSPYLSGPDYTYPNTNLLTKNNFDLTNPGNAPSPFYLKLAMGSDSGYFRIQTKAYGYFGFTYSFLAGDVVTIDTTPGRRTATLTRSGVSGTINLLPAIDTLNVATANWLQLVNGLNGLSLIMVGTVFTVQSLIIYPKYWGV